MHLLFQIQSLQLSIFCIYDPELFIYLGYVLLCSFFYYIVIFNFFIFARSIYLCFYWIYWLYSFTILSTQCNLSNFFSEHVMFLVSKSFCDFNINLLCFMNFLWLSVRLSASSFFLIGLFYFQSELPLNNFYNLQI